MQINPLTHPPEASGKIESRAGGASKINNESNRSLPSQERQSDSSARLKQLKSALAEYDITLNYRHDDASNRLVITMVDDTTGEAIRQIPNEVSLKLSAQIQGQFLDQTV
ncbi:MAG: flagellar protein FlaG [Pyrinomonadaceae bacterium]|nr:flagellar protein FlaG [Pyrinomonadaceae bacterium]